LKITASTLTNILLTIVLLGSVFFIGITSSQVAYDPLLDVTGDGYGGIDDIVKVAEHFGASGTPINWTQLLLNVSELQAEVDALNAAVISLKQCIVVNGNIPYDGNGGYDITNGLSQDVSGLIPSGFTLVAAVATGYKAHQMTGVRQAEPPLILEPKVSGTSFQTRVWDASGDEYGGANWSGMRAHIDFTLFITK
jgi:hypothetical protein